MRTKHRQIAVAGEEFDQIGMVDGDAIDVAADGLVILFFEIGGQDGLAGVRVAPGEGLRSEIVVLQRKIARERFPLRVTRTAGCGRTGPVASRSATASRSSS